MQDIEKVEEEVQGQDPADATPIEYAQITPDFLKTSGVLMPTRARKLFFSWTNPDNGETHNLAFFYKELTFGAVERLSFAKKQGDTRMLTDMLSECLFADVNAKKKLFTAKQLQEELHPSFVSAIVLAVEGAQKKTT